jgi:hypothetical protein
MQAAKMERSGCCQHQNEELMAAFLIMQREKQGLFDRMSL